MKPKRDTATRAPLAKSEVLARLNLAKRLLDLSADQHRQAMQNQSLARAGIVELLLELEEGGAL